MDKPSKGVLIYLVTMFIGWFLSVTQLWKGIFIATLQIGLTNSQAMKTIELLFSPTPFPEARWAGIFVGGLIALVVLVGMLRLKPWARKSLLLVTVVGLIVYAIRLPRLLSLYKYIASGEMWLGYYLFVFLTLVGIAYPISVLIFFSREDVKKQFGEGAV